MSIRLLLAMIAVLVTGSIALVQAQVSGTPYRLTDKQVEYLIRNVEKQADRFRDSLRSALNKSRLDGTNREDDVNEFVKQFDREVKHLHDRFSDHKSTSSDIQIVLERASWIERFMRRNTLQARAQNDWSGLKTNLSTLADAYSVEWRWDGSFNPGVIGQPYRPNDQQVEEIIHRVEGGADRFRKSLDSALDHSRLDGTRREDDINAFVKAFDKQVKTLHDHFDDHKATSGDVETVLNRAAEIDRFMSDRRRLDAKAREDWSALRANLDELARVYNVSWRWLF